MCNEMSALGYLGLGCEVYSGGGEDKGDGGGGEDFQ